MIQRLQITNFRNYQSACITLSPNITAFIGDNAQGKTNLAEALFLCCIGKSHRTGKESDLILWDTDEAKIVIEYQKSTANNKIEMILRRNGKKTILLNGVPLKRISELFGNVYVVLFAPEDLQLVKEGSVVKRTALNMELSQLSVRYFHALRQYNQALLQKNAVFKQQQIQTSVLDAFDEQLALYGAYLTKQRREYIDKLHMVAKDIHMAISGGEELQLQYVPGFIAEGEDLQSTLFAALQKGRDVDLQRRYTSEGPHRDTFDIFINGMDARRFASQGQQRTAVLALKIAYLTILHEQIGFWPLLILDDVMSELDEKRRAFFVEYIKNIQTVITCADPAVMELLSVEKTYRIHNQQVYLET